MQKIQLSQFCTIKGIGSASGLLYHKNTLFIISDNSSYLYQYRLENKKVLKIPLVKNPQENIPKKEKLDLEAIAKYGNQIFIFGSGSTENRNTMFSLHLEKNVLQKNNFSQLYQQLSQLAALNPNQLNIEGAIFTHKNMLLFQRGNGTNGKNGIFIVPNINTFPHKFIPISLPKIANVQTTFTDAVLIENDIYFLAAAENTLSTYEDGEVLGTIIGKMNVETFEILQTQIVSTTHKFEGLTLYQNHETEISFLLCEDTDTEILESTIYSLTLEKQ